MYFDGSSEINSLITDAVIRIAQGEDADTVMSNLDAQAKKVVEENNLKGS